MARQIAFWASTILAFAAINVLFSWFPDAKPVLLLSGAIALFSFIAGLCAKRI